MTQGTVLTHQKSTHLFSAKEPGTAICAIKILAQHSNSLYSTGLHECDSPDAERSFCHASDTILAKYSYQVLIKLSSPMLEIYNINNKN